MRMGIGVELQEVEMALAADVIREGKSGAAQPDAVADPKTAAKKVASP